MSDKIFLTNEFLEEVEMMPVKKRLPVDDDQSRLLIKALKGIASFYFSKVCQDTDPDWLKDFSKQELNQMAKDAHRFNGDPESYDPDEELDVGSFLYLFSHYLEIGSLTDKEYALLNKLLDNFEEIA